MSYAEEPFGNIERLICLKQIEALVSSVAEIQGALVSTIDGFEIAACLPHGMAPSRLSAMASSQLALAEALCSESKVQTCRNIVIEADYGNILVMDIPNRRHRLLLTVISNSQTTLGQLLWNIRECSHSVGAKLNSGMESAIA